ncbi:MAG: hypothetical protein WDN76_13545 [Alphaproteobacteria bacterium]
MSAALAHKSNFEHAAPPAPRRDLRTGVLAAGWVDARDLDCVDWVEALSYARAVWAAQGPLSAPAPMHMFEAGAASRLDALLRGAGFGMRSVTIEFDEADLKLGGAAGFETVERLRARGWGVALRCGSECVLALGARLRSVLTEILVEAPADLRPDLALHDEPSPLLGRVRAANNAGIVVTALQVKSPAHAGMLIAMGFDRGAY